MGKRKHYGYHWWEPVPQIDGVAPRGVVWYFPDPFGDWNRIVERLESVDIRLFTRPRVMWSEGVDIRGWIRLSVIYLWWRKEIVVVLWGDKQPLKKEDREKAIDCLARIASILGEPHQHAHGPYESDEKMRQEVIEKAKQIQIGG